MPEALVELRSGATLEAIGAAVELHQQLPPRLAIVAGDNDSLRALARSPGVLSVHTAEVPEYVLSRLDEPARTFAAAWNERRRAKERPGDKLPWDAPGHDAP